jgi:hypothetical protein
MMQAGITSPFAGVSAACVATFRIQLFMPLFSLFFNRILMPFDSDVHGAPRASPCLHAEVLSLAVSLDTSFGTHPLKGTH